MILGAIIGTVLTFIVGDLFQLSNGMIPFVIFTSLGVIIGFIINKKRGVYKRISWSDYGVSIGIATLILGLIIMGLAFLSAKDSGDVFTIGGYLSILGLIILWLAMKFGNKS